MEELMEIAKAYYEKSSNEHQKLARDFFYAMDHDGDGKIDQKEFIEFLIDEGYSQITRLSFFRQLDLDGNGTLDFYEVMTLYYILKSGRPFCDKCKMFIPNTYFTCVGCLEDGGGVSSVHLCLPCYTAQRCDHTHNGLSRYVDNYSLLEVMRKANLSTAKSRPSQLVSHYPSSSANANHCQWSQYAPNAWNQSPIPSQCNLYPPIAPVYHQTYVLPERQRWKLAFQALEAAVHIGAYAGAQAGAHAGVAAAVGTCSIL
ncbi:hypothetical protein OSB04_026661 [Centaurea solstitialis]|uniref:EF-hand domain-containing protein n=1 Tax=Centaurea solstitialis TaxID=347529 RepID=A0AA38W635_9ASTR|nr:hypothetical protein OSB04_026661 [Centaurea solstitialis]